MGVSSALGRLHTLLQTSMCVSPGAGDPPITYTFLKLFRHSEWKAKANWYLPHIVGTLVVVLLTLLSAYLPESKRFKFTEALIMLLVFMGLPLTIALLMPLATAIVSTQTTGYLFLSLSAALLLVLGLVGDFFFWSFWRPKLHNPRSKEAMDLALRVFFFFRTLLAAFAYYALKYDSEGTVKPPWAGQLGLERASAMNTSDSRVTRRVWLLVLAVTRCNS